MEYSFPWFLIGENAFLGYADDEGEPREHRQLPYAERFTVPAVIGGHPVVAVYDIDIPPCGTLVFEEGIEEIDLSGVEVVCREIILPQSLHTLCPASFAAVQGLERAVIPAGLIRPSAFRDCTTLRGLVLGEGVTGIRSGAFSGCTALEEIVIPDGVSVLGHPEDSGSSEGLFAGCSSLKRAVIGAGVREMWSNPFSGCAALAEITVSPDNTFYAMRDGMLIDRRRSMLIHAFPRADGRLTVPPHIMEIISGALRGSAWLTELVYESEHVTATRKHAFASCVNLCSAIVRGEVDEYAFSGCTALETVCLCRGTEIGDYAFAGCTNLRNVVVEPGMKSIGAAAFAECTALESVRLPASIIMIADDAFGALPSVTLTVPRGSYAAVFAEWMGVPCRLVGEAPCIAMTEAARLHLLDTELAGLLAMEGLRAITPPDAAIPAEALNWAREVTLYQLRQLRRAGIDKVGDLRGLTLPMMREKRLSVGVCLSLMHLAGLL